MEQTKQTYNDCLKKIALTLLSNPLCLQMQTSFKLQVFSLLFPLRTNCLQIQTERTLTSPGLFSKASQTSRKKATMQMFSWADSNHSTDFDHYNRCISPLCYCNDPVFPPQLPPSRTRSC